MNLDHPVQLENQKDNIHHRFALGEDIDKNDYAELLFLYDNLVTQYSFLYNRLIQNESNKYE